MVSFPAFVQNGRFSLAHRRTPSSAAHLDSLPAHTAANAVPTGYSFDTSHSEAGKLGSEPAPHVVVPLTPRSDLDSTLSRSTSRANRRPEEVKRQNETEQDRLQGLMRSATVRRVESRDEKAGEEGDRWLRAKVWLRQDGPSALVLLVWLLLQLGFFAVGVVRYDLNRNFSNARAIFGSTYVIARSAAFVLHIDVVFILLPICRNLVTLLRRTSLNKAIPLDESVEFHKVVAWSLVFWTAVHTIAHLFNSWWLGAKLATTATAALLLALDTNFTTGPFLTGWIMLVLLGIMAFFAVEKRRRPHFQRFYWSHHLFIPFFVLWQFHGMFCMIKPDRPPYCSWTQIGVFWMYWILGGLVYIGERILREIRSRHRTYLSKVVVHPSNVIELRIKKEKTPRVRPGQFIMICCPSVSYWQRHPFTLTSAPEEDFLSVHIRIVGDWTRQLAVVLGCEQDKELLSEEWTREKLLSPSVIRPLPRVMVRRASPLFLLPLPRLAQVDGPFGTATEDVLKYEVTVLVGAGIGVTPFAAILKHIWYRLNDPDRDPLDQKLRKVYFFWICRDAESFEWFRDLLHSLEEQDFEGRIEIHTYLTATIKAHDMLNIFANDVGSDRDAITQLRAPTHYGRPNWDRIFASIAAEHPASEVGVFFCGPKPLSTTLYKMCIKHTTGEAGKTRFTFSKERF